MKYTGIKRNLAPEILSYFPKDIDVFIEPFCGSASITLTMIKNGWNVRKYIISDSNENVVKLLNRCKTDPYSLIDTYYGYYQSFNKEMSADGRKNIFNLVRSDFNKTKDSSLFLCLLRTCINGLVRFNSNGDFNSSCHFTRSGIKPETLERQIMECHELLRMIDIRNADYSEYKSSDGFFFLDPPYLKSTTMYNGSFNHNLFFEWLSKIDNFRMTMDDGLDLSHMGLDGFDLQKVKSSHERVNHNRDHYIKERIFYRK